MTLSQPRRAGEGQPAPEPRRKTPIVGVLLVHGLHGSQDDMEGLDAHLRARGMLSVNMLLPGHGDGLRVRERWMHGWEEWSQAVHDELTMLKRRCDLVFLVGHSLGGALILHVAAHEKVDGVIAMCAPLRPYTWTLPLLRAMKYVLPAIPWVWDDVRYRKARRVYHWATLSPIESLLRFLPQLWDELPHITAPALIMVSAHDHVVPPRDGREIYHRIGSREKYLVTFHRSYHVITMDHDREEVFAKTSAFILEQAKKAGFNPPRVPVESRMHGTGS